MACQLFNKFSAFCGTQRFIAVFTKPRHCPLFWIRRMKSTALTPQLLLYRLSLNNQTNNALYFLVMFNNPTHVSAARWTQRKIYRLSCYPSIYVKVFEVAFSLRFCDYNFEWVSHLTVVLRVLPISPSLDHWREIIIVCSLDLKLVWKKLAENISCKIH